MQLMTKAIQLALPTSEMTDNVPSDELMAKVKYFTPDGNATWYGVAYDPDDRLLLAWCDLGLGYPELGFVSLDELEGIRGKLGLPVERDLHWQPVPLSELMTV